MVAAASLWDGKTAPDPVGQMLERAKRERDDADAENALTDEEWLAKKAREQAAADADITFNVQRKMDLTLNGEHMSREQALEHLKTLEGKPLMNAASRFITVINLRAAKDSIILSL